MCGAVLPAHRAQGAAGVPAPSDAQKACSDGPALFCVCVFVCVCIPWIGRVDCSVYKCEPSVGIAHWSVYERMMDRERRW